VLFGTGPDAQVRACDIRVDEQARARFRLTVGDGSGAGQQVDVALLLHGVHHVANALAAAAVAVELGMPLPRVAELLGQATPVSRGRMAVGTRADGLVVVNDAYNSNPDSVRAALHALTAMRRPGSRTWAVLGEMLELGDTSPAEHRGVGELAVRLGVDRLVAVGEGARPVLEPVPGSALGPGAGTPSGTEAVWEPDADAALQLLRRQTGPGDVVLVKASRAIGLDRLAEALLETPAPRAARRREPADAPPDGVASDDAPSQPGQDGPVTGAGAAGGAIGEVAQ